MTRYFEPERSHFTIQTPAAIVEAAHTVFANRHRRLARRLDQWIPRTLGASAAVGGAMYSGGAWLMAGSPLPDAQLAVGGAAGGAGLLFTAAYLSADHWHKLCSKASSLKGTLENLDHLKVIQDKNPLGTTSCDIVNPDYEPGQRKSFPYIIENGNYRHPSEHGQMLGVGREGRTALRRAYKLAGQSRLARAARNLAEITGVAALVGAAAELALPGATQVAAATFGIVAAASGAIAVPAVLAARRLQGRLRDIALRVRQTTTGSFHYEGVAANIWYPSAMHQLGRLVRPAANAFDALHGTPVRDFAFSSEELAPTAPAQHVAETVVSFGDAPAPVAPAEAKPVAAQPELVLEPAMIVQAPKAEIAAPAVAGKTASATRVVLTMGGLGLGLVAIALLSKSAAPRKPTARPAVTPQLRLAA